MSREWIFFGLSELHIHYTYREAKSGVWVMHAGDKLTCPEAENAFLFVSSARASLLLLLGSWLWHGGKLFAA